MKFYTSEGITKILELLKTYLINKFNIVNQDINGKVDKNGSDRLMTTNEGNKLSEIENNAQVNIIESISLNGVNISPDINKNVALTVITNTVDNLINYYKKNETYTKDEVDTLIGAITTLDIRVVNELPTEDISTTTIYLIPAEDPGTQNIKNEYINLTGTSMGWEKIGSTAIDLSDYYTKDEVNILIGQIDLSVFYTKTETDNLLLSKADLVNGKVPLSELPNIGGKQEVFVFESENNFPAQGEINTLYISQESGKSYIWEIVSNEYTFSGSYCTINNIGGVEAPVTMEATITDWYYPSAPPSTWVGFQNNSYPSTEPPYIGVAFDAIMAKIGKTAPVAGDKVTFYKYNGVTSIIYNSEGTDYDISDCLYTTGGTTYGHDLYIVENVNQQFSGILAGPGAATYRGYQNLERYKVISGEVVQSDWDQEIDSAPDYIKNKPELGTAASKDIPESGNASATEVVMGNDTRLTDARTPAAHTHILANIIDYDYLDPTNYTSYKDLILNSESKLKYLYKVSGEVQDSNNYVRKISRLYYCMENNTTPTPIDADLYGNSNCVITNATAEGHTNKPLVMVIKPTNGQDVTIPNGQISFTFYVQISPNQSSSIVNSINGSTLKNIIGSTVLKADESIVIYTGESVAFLIKADRTKINIIDAVQNTIPYYLTTINIMTVNVEGQSFANAQYINCDNSNFKIDAIYDAELEDVEFGKYLYNKVTSAITQNQVDWAQTDPTADDYIKNKPASGNGLPIVTEMPENPTDGQLVVWGGDDYYIKGHTYRYDENKIDWISVIEDCQSDINMNDNNINNINNLNVDSLIVDDEIYTNQIYANESNYISVYGSFNMSGNSIEGISTVSTDDISTKQIHNYEYDYITVNSSLDMNSNDINNIDNINMSSLNVNTISNNGESTITMESNLDFDSQYSINNASSITTNELYVSSITGQDNNILVNNPIEINDESSGTSTYYKYNGINGDDFNIQVNHLYYNNEEVATKNDLQNLATKNDLQNLATKSDLQNLATKSDLQNLYTSNIYGIEDNDIIINNNIDLDGNDIVNADIVNSNIIQANSTKSPKMGYAEYFKALKTSNVVPYRFVKINETNSNYIELSQADGSNPYIGISATNAMIIGNNNQTVTSSEENILVGLTGSFWIDIYEDENIVPGNFVAPEDGGYASKTTQQFYPQVIKVDSVNNRCLVLLK